jgi:hypothetical protein
MRVLLCGSSLWILELIPSFIGEAQGHMDEPEIPTLALSLSSCRKGGRRGKEMRVLEGIRAHTTAPQVVSTLGRHPIWH